MNVDRVEECRASEVVPRNVAADVEKHNEVTVHGDVLAMLVSTLQTVQAELSRLTAANTEMSERLARLTEKVEPAKVESRAEYRARLEPVAILAIQQVGPVREQISKATGVPVSTLRRWDRFEQALRTVQGMADAEAVEKFRSWDQDDLP